MAHTSLTWKQGRGTITVDGVQIPNVRSVSMDLNANDPIGTITINVVATEVTAEVDAINTTFRNLSERLSGQRFTTKPGGGAHTWRESTTMERMAAGQSEETCTRCNVKRVTLHGSKHSTAGTCPGRHPDDHTA